MENKKIYGITVVNTEGFLDGSESDTNLYTNQERCLKEMYERYKKDYKNIKNEGRLESDCKLLNYEEFADEVVNTACVYIQGYDFHIQYEYFEKEWVFEKSDNILFLPCPLGATIYMIVTKRPKHNFPEFSFVKESKLSFYNMEKVLEEFGKTVFLTREEANAVLATEREASK